MATGLVKWWRARFFAGYKPFSVVGNGEGSDSEELLAAVATACTAPPAPQLQAHQESQSSSSTAHPISTEPPRITTNASTGSPATAAPVCDEQPTGSTAKQQLSFEEFECDVSVAEGDRKRQEFSFTLYDFDGHGKITKDDIAGLVTTIYDTLGASIQVPPCGSKTIKVKLTVSPDQRTNQARATCFDSTQAGNYSPCCRSKEDAGVSCEHRNAARNVYGPRRIARRRRPLRNRFQMDPKENAETHSEEDAENVRSNRAKQEEVRRRVGPVPHLQSPYSNSSEGDVSDDSEASPVSAFSPSTPLIASNQRKRSGALQRQQLLEIIQANMEKNNLSFHTSRKRPQNEETHVPNTRSTRFDVSRAQNLGYKPFSETRPTATVYQKPVRETSHQGISLLKIASKSRGNHRKIRAQHIVQRNNLQPPRANQQAQPQLLKRNVAARSPTCEERLKSNVEKNTSNVPPRNDHRVDQGVANNKNMQRNDAQHAQSQQYNKSSKKHELKHVTREQDQARAMAQVVRWLEREFSQNAANATTSRRHVHEHIHHHYHHYHAEALV